MKKLLAFSLSVILLACGCANISQEPIAEDMVTLTVWINAGLINTELIQDDFNREFEEQGIRVDFHEYDAGNAMRNLQLETNLMAGGGIDVYLTYTTQALSKRVYSGCALDLSELCRRDGIDPVEIYSPLVTRIFYDGRPYSMPSSVGKMGMILNKDLFDEAGIDVPTEWTFDEFREIAGKLTKTDAYGTTYGVYWNTNNNLSEALLHLVLPTLGGDPLYRQGGRAGNLNDPVIAAALELIYNTMHVDRSAPTYEDSYVQHATMEDLFFNQRCAMTVGAWMFGSVLDTQAYPHDFVTAFAPWPVVDEGKRYYVQGSYGANLSINPKSAHIDEAWEFIKWFVTKGCRPYISEGYIPAYNGFSQDLIAEQLLKNTRGLVDEESVVSLFLNPDNNMSVPSISKKIPETTEIFEAAVEKVLLGRMPVQDALDEANRQADLLLAQNAREQ